MKTSFLLVFVTLFFLNASAQTADNIVGKWKIVAVDAGFFHDFRNDSTYFPPEMMESLKGNKDSAFTVGFFEGMIRSFENYFYNFSSNKEYQEIKNDRTKEKGIYEIVSESKKIVLNAKDKFGRETRQNLLYELTGKTLILKIPSDEMNLKIHLMKAE